MNMLGWHIRVDQNACGHGCCHRYWDVYARTNKRERAREKVQWRREMWA